MSQIHPSTRILARQAPTDVLTAALQLAQAGFCVLPLKARSKVPATDHGVQGATADIRAVADLFRGRSSANIGGYLPGTVVIDVDPRNGGDLADLPLSADDRRTLTQHTGGGGLHLIYTLPDPPAGRQWLQGELCPGVDVKLPGKGYIVLAPSIHPDTGRAYRWAEGLGPGQIAVRPCPEAILLLLPTAPLAGAGQRQARRSSPSDAPSTDYGRKMAVLLQGLGLDPVSGLQLCIFHDDHNPSLSVDLAAGVFYCFSPRCVAHGGGGYVDLRRLAMQVFGFDPDAQPEPDPPPPPAPPPPAPRPAAPWRITPDDWRRCPECGTFRQVSRSDGNGGGHSRLTHGFCHRRECPVWQKARAGDVLDEVLDWGGIFVASIAADDWRRVRDALQDDGRRWVGLPTPGGAVLAVADAHFAGATPTEDVNLLYAAVLGVPAGKRIRQPQRHPRMPRAVIPAQFPTVDPAPEGDTSFAALTKPERDERDELKAICRALRTGGLDPGAMAQVLAMWRGVGAAVDGREVHWTLEQGRAMVARVQEWRASISAIGRSSIAAIDEPPGVPQPRFIAPEAPCSICGKVTSAWWLYDGRSHSCKCRECGA